MSKPLSGSHQIMSYFDHEYPNYVEDWTDPVTLFTGEIRNVSYGGHPGIDYDTEYQDFILSVADGNIAHAGIRTDNSAETCTMADGNLNEYAKYVAVDYDLNNDSDPDIRALYWHLSSNRNIGEPSVPGDDRDWQPNEEVNSGQILGLSGNTGNVSPCPANDQDNNSGTHLHLEIRADPALIDPDHPNPYSGPSKLDPFGWWSISRSDPITGNPINYTYSSKWLWKSFYIVDDQDPSFDKFGGSSFIGTDHINAFSSHAWLSNNTAQWAVWGLSDRLMEIIMWRFMFQEYPGITQWYGSSLYAMDLTI